MKAILLQSTVPFQHVRKARRFFMYVSSDHTFAVCAYKESPYLFQCLESLANQVSKSRIIVATATPNAHIENVCSRFGVELYVNDKEPGIASDWNFAMSRAESALVTIAHQDDVYGPEYSSRMLKMVNSADVPLLYFTNYGEVRGEGRVEENELLRVKRAMLKPLEGSLFRSSRFVRRRILSMGSAICCPSVTMVVSNIPMPLFREGLKSNLDWEAWERVSRLQGSFLYDPLVLMYHRIHEGSETTALIKDNTRTEEDLFMFEKFWPRPVARMLGKAYFSSQRSNG